MRSSRSQDTIQALRSHGRCGLGHDDSEPEANSNPSLRTHNESSDRHRISFYPPSPSLHFSPRFSKAYGSPSTDLCLVEHLPIASARPEATVNDGLFLALLMKNISTPKLVSTTNTDIDTLCSGTQSHPDSATNTKAKPTGDKEVAYFNVGLDENHSASSDSIANCYQSGDPESSVRSFIDFLEKCDAEFLMETARLSESIKYTQDLIKQVRSERLLDQMDSEESEIEDSSGEELTPVVRHQDEGDFAY